MGEGDGRLLLSPCGFHHSLWIGDRPYRSIHSLLMRGLYACLIRAIFTVRLISALPTKGNTNGRILCNTEERRQRDNLRLWAF